MTCLGASKLTLAWLFLGANVVFAHDQNSLSQDQHPDASTFRTTGSPIDVQLWATANFDWDGNGMPDFWKAFAENFSGNVVEFRPRVYIPGGSSEELVVESARRLCLWDIYGQTGVSEAAVKYFDYVACDILSKESCLERAYQMSGVSSLLMHECMSTFSESLVEKEVNDAISMEISDEEMPVVLVDGQKLSNTNPDAILRNICQALPDENKPSICGYCTEYCKEEGANATKAISCLKDLDCGRNDRLSFYDWVASTSMPKMEWPAEGARILQTAQTPAPTVKATTLVMEGAPGTYYTWGKKDPATQHPGTGGVLHADHTVKAEVVGYHDEAGYHAYPGHHLPKQLDDKGVSQATVWTTFSTVTAGAILIVLGILLLAYRRATIGRAARDMHLPRPPQELFQQRQVDDEEDGQMDGAGMEMAAGTLDLDELPDFSNYVVDKEAEDASAGSGTFWSNPRGKFA